MSRDLEARLAAARRLAASGRYTTMRALARAARVSESTLRRHDIRPSSAAASNENEASTETGPALPAHAYTPQWVGLDGGRYVALPAAHAYTPTGTLSEFESDEASLLVAQAVADQPGGLFVSQLQSESPDGLAHSAISALQRGDRPTDRAQASLDATVDWRVEWSRWHDAQSAWHSMQSRLQTAERSAGQARAHADQARACLAWYGGKLGSLSEHDAALRLRGAYAQTARITPTGPSVWQHEMHEIRSKLSAHVAADQRISPAGLRVGDLGGVPAEKLPVEPLVAAWARTVASSGGLQRAARRWATAACAPILAAEREAVAEAEDINRRSAAIDPVEMIGEDAVNAMLAAAQAAQAAGVRVQPHQTETISQMQVRVGRRQQSG